MLSPLGQVVNIYPDCLLGKCECLYRIGDIPSQLELCRFVAIIFSKGLMWVEKYLSLLWNVTDGFPIVDCDVPQYECENYSSITCGSSKVKMDEIVRRELAEGCISLSTERPCPGSCSQRR